MKPRRRTKRSARHPRYSGWQKAGLLLLGLVWIGLSGPTGCIWDPGTAPPLTLDDGETRAPLAKTASLLLPQDAHAAFVHGDMAYICTRKATVDTGPTTTAAPNPDEKPIFGVAVIDLSAEKLLWSMDESSCFFTVDEASLYHAKVYGDQQRWQIERRDLRTGKILATRDMGAFDVPFVFPFSGPGRALQMPTPSPEPWRRTRFQAQGPYLLWLGPTHAQLLLKDSLKLHMNIGVKRPSRWTQNVFDARLDAKGEILYTVRRIDHLIADGEATSLDPKFSRSQSVIEQHVVQAIDCKAKVAIWQKQHLPYPLLGASIALSDEGLLVQLRTNYDTNHDADFHLTPSDARGTQVTKQIYTTLHYYLRHNSGRLFWKEPWVLRHEERVKAATHIPNPNSILWLGSERAYIHAGKSLFALSLKSRKMDWERPTLMQQPGRLLAYPDDKLLYSGQDRAVLYRKAGGTEYYVWKEGSSLLLPEISGDAPQLAGPASKPGEIMTVQHRCLLANGKTRIINSQNGRALVPGTVPYYEEANRNGFFRVFCVKHILQISGSAPIKDSSQWHRYTEIKEGDPEFVFLHKNKVFMVANKDQFLAYHFPQ